MILQNTFYTIDSIDSIDSSENELLAKLTINKDHTIFDGHFPENPVTPGVVQLEIIKELLSGHFNRKLKLVSLSNCKFLAILNPEETPKVQVQLNLKLEDDLIKISGQITSGEVGYLKVAAVYQ